MTFERFITNTIPGKRIHRTVAQVLFLQFVKGINNGGASAGRLLCVTSMLRSQEGGWCFIMLIYSDFGLLHAGDALAGFLSR